jgi:outer membrane protein TolC
MGTGNGAMACSFRADGFEMCGLISMCRREQWDGGIAWVCWALMVSAWAGGCSPAWYKAKADAEVYKIIDSKWQARFGAKVNYTVADGPSSPDDIRVDRRVVSGVLSLPQAVALATAYNRDYQQQKDLLYLTALDLTLVRHQFARQWFGTIDAQYANDRDAEWVSSGGAVGFNQVLADGAAISTAIALDWVEFLTGDPRTSLGTVLSASICQPLLRGSGRRVAQEDLTQAERDTLYQIRSFNRFRETFVVSIVNDYYRVLQLRDAVVNARNDYERRVQSKERLEMEAEAGRRPSFEVDQAVQDALRAQDNLVAAEKRHAQALDAFKIRLALPTDADVELDPNELEALRRMEVAAPDYTLEAAVETALARRLDLANSADAVEDAARRIAVAADCLRADLNLVGGTALRSRSDTDFTRLDWGRSDYRIGLEGSLPLDRKAERNEYRAALLALERQRREHENDVDTVKLDVREAFRQLQQQAESYRIQKSSLTLAEKRVESTSLLLQAGRVTTRDLLESQDALLQAQNDLTAALVAHTIAKLNFFRDIGLLRVRPDGMWEPPPELPQATARAASGPPAALTQEPACDFLAKPERFWEGP